MIITQIWKKDEIKVQQTELTGTCDLFYDTEHVILIPETINRQKNKKKSKNKKSEHLDAYGYICLYWQETRKLSLTAGIC